MKVIESVAQWRTLRATLPSGIGFVPTMGALHAGHAALIERARGENEIVVVSIYVNPTQFDQASDLAAYPVPLDADLRLLADLRVDYVLLPSYAEIYPDGFRFRVEETQFSRELCGAHRAGHFTGVLTVVAKLLNLVHAQRAYFGEKDYQQYELIRDMAAALFIDTAIVPCRTVRESDGLALSSRNVRLDADGRRLAPNFHRLLEESTCDAEAAAQLRCLGFDVDYVATVRGRRFGAVRVKCGADSVRLIDNVEVTT
jgi:pantoate--beta-alanine ligase